MSISGSHAVTLLAHWRIGALDGSPRPGGPAPGHCWPRPGGQCIRAEGVARGLPLVLAALKTLGKGSVRIQDRLPLNAAGERITGYDLTEEIEQALATRA